MRILLVEDDLEQANAIETALHSHFSDLTIWNLYDEYAFRCALPSLRDDPPDIVIMDVILRWHSTAPSFPPPPPDVREGGVYRSGLRCLAMLLKSSEFSKTPVVLYSALDRGNVSRELENLPDHVFFLTKDSSDTSLILHLRSLQAAVGAPPAAPSGWRSRLWQSIEVKPGWLGFAIDLKRFIRGKPSKRDR
jgi:CheY-like chemotaxis protein